MERKTQFVGNFENIFKIFKKFRKKIAKKYYFSIFSKNLTKHALNYCAFGTKNANCWEILRKFSKVILRKLLKCIILAYFPKKFNKSWVNFLRIWTKNANCWEISRKLSKVPNFFLGKLLKMHHFAYFQIF